MTFKKLVASHFDIKSFWPCTAAHYEILFLSQRHERLRDSFCLLFKSRNLSCVWVKKIYSILGRELKRLHSLKLPTNSSLVTFKSKITYNKEFYRIGREGSKACSYLGRKLIVVKFVWIIANISRYQNFMNGSEFDQSDGKIVYRPMHDRKRCEPIGVLKLDQGYQIVS